MCEHAYVRTYTLVPGHSRMPIAAPSSGVGYDTRKEHASELPALREEEGRGRPPPSSLSDIRNTGWAKQGAGRLGRGRAQNTFPGSGRRNRSACGAKAVAVGLQHTSTMPIATRKRADMLGKLCFQLTGTGKITRKN